VSDQPEDDVLHQTIVALLAQLFYPILRSIDRAKEAAAISIERLQLRAEADIFSISQIIAFTLSANNTLGRAMDDGVTPVMLLKLNASATALSRCEARSRKFLLTQPTRKRAPKPPPPTEEAEIDAEAQKQLLIARTLQAVAREVALQREEAPRDPETGAKPATLPVKIQGVEQTVTTDPKKLHWVLSYAQVAEACIHDPDDLAQGCRKEANLRAKLLNECAWDVLLGITAEVNPEIDLARRPKPKPQ
jgi:hypothetical protein